MVLYYNQQRFILIVTKPEINEDTDVVADLFLKIEEAEQDADDMMADRYLEDFRELTIAACKETMYTLAASAQQPQSNQLSLEEVLRPVTFYLQICSVKGKLQATTIDNVSGFASMDEPVHFPVDCMSEPIPALIPSAEVQFIEDVFMRKVFKVSRNGEVCVFKMATEGNEGQLKREVDVLRRMSEMWSPNHPGRPHVPQFLGLVIATDSQVMGILEDYIEGTNLRELDMHDAATTMAQRQKWKRQIEHTMTQLHQSDLVWGDVKAENVLIDKTGNAWLVDFGGSSTDGWVDEELVETVEGDMQGFSRLVQYLGVQN
ncbi:MAG: hypothetical protein Q9227_009191 [Pyrenula ochraceoflavens]